MLKRLWEWFDDRTGVGGLFLPMLKHKVPPDSKWAYVFGSATLFAFTLQVVTGICLALAYVPSAGSAYDSLKYITDVAPLGNVLRALHYFGASAMVLLVGIHTIRVFIFGAYKYPREVSWLSGVALLFLTVGMGFTGQLLRWDQNGVWSVIVGAEQAGRVPIIGPWVARFVLAGDTVGGATLSRFFAFHVFFIPAIIFLMVGLHVWLVLYNGISEPPQAGRPVNPKTYKAWYHALMAEKGVPFWPDAAWRDVLFGVCMLGVVLVLACHYGPPELTKPPDPTLLDTNPRPDWYLLWYFAVLALLPPALEKYVMVFGPLLFAVLMFLVPFLHRNGERSWLRRPWAMGAVLLVVLTIATLWTLGLRSPWSPDFTAEPLPGQVVGTLQGPVSDGARLFHDKGCEYCHAVGGYGGHRGPDLTWVGDRLSQDQLTLRIMNGGHNMPSFASTVNHQELAALVAFLQSRKEQR
ncbi:MAG TPA: cytochrome b N-terminal domain-containing protein [Candidatus Xenobia bacterium]|jgi:ubiquinol-cytochrome c reductase cytochrome b subunit